MLQSDGQRTHSIWSEQEVSNNPPPPPAMPRCSRSKELQQLVLAHSGRPSSPVLLVTRRDQSRPDPRPAPPLGPGTSCLGLQGSSSCLKLLYGYELPSQHPACLSPSLVLPAGERAGTARDQGQLSVCSWHCWVPALCPLCQTVVSPAAGR